MSAILETSTTFASATASGTDWRDIGRKLLEGLESVRTEHDDMNIGFLYVTADMVPDLTSLLTLLKNVTHIRHWYGASGQGICGGGTSISSKAAAVAMIGSLPADSFREMRLPHRSDVHLPDKLREWVQAKAPATVITHGVLGSETVACLKTLREDGHVFTLGGFTSASAGGRHITHGEIAHATDMLSGLVLSGDVRVLSATSFGCMRAGKIGRITSCQGQTIEHIDDRPAFEFLNEAIDDLAHKAHDLDAPRTGHVHAAFPITGNDRATLLVRNIGKADEKTGTLSVAHAFERGDAIQFVYRDAPTACADLAHVLTELYGRASEEMGATNLKPKALLYFGCGARLPDIPANDEAAIVAKVFPGVPMAGFYTAAEICNGHVYGYTGVIVLFL